MITFPPNRCFICENYHSVYLWSSRWEGDITLNGKFVEFQSWRSDPTWLERITVPVENNWFSHVPLRMEDSGLAVAILRKPSDRLASQFRWMRSMLAMVTIYGVFVPVQQILNNLPDISKLNESHPCFKARTPNEARLCRFDGAE